MGAYRTRLAPLLLGFLAVACGSNTGGGSERSFDPPDLYGHVESSTGHPDLNSRFATTLLLTDGTSIEWGDMSNVERSGCANRVEHDSGIPPNCPVYVWYHDDGSLERIIGANWTEVRLGGSEPEWVLFAELYEWVGDSAASSIGLLPANPALTLERDAHCGPPAWMIDPPTGQLIEFLGYGATLWSDPSACSI